MRRTAEEWGRIAVSLPGWEWMPGMLTAHGRICGAGYLVSDDIDESGQSYVDCTDSTDDWTELTPDPDDPATAGCMLELLGEQWGAYHYRPTEHPAHTPYEIVIDGVGDCVTDASTLGRSCIIAAAALGRWPGGDK